MNYEDLLKEIQTFKHQKDSPDYQDIVPGGKYLEASPLEGPLKCLFVQSFNLFGKSYCCLSFSEKFYQFHKDWKEGFTTDTKQSDQVSVESLLSCSDLISGDYTPVEIFLVLTTVSTRFCPVTLHIYSWLYWFTY